MLPGGIVGFMILRPRLLASTAQGTLTNLTTHANLARTEVAAMMTVIVAQALAALGFYALYRGTRPTVAFGIAAFGLLNSAAILAGAAASWTAIELAGAGTGGADLIHAFYLFEANAWKLGGLFFGLWLIPMGIGAATTHFFHAGRVLGGFLIVGGIAYVLGSFLALSPSLAASGIPDGVASLAMPGELWTMFALLVVGVRTRQPGSPEPEDHRAT